MADTPTTTTGTGWQTFNNLLGTAGGVAGNILNGLNTSNAATANQTAATLNATVAAQKAAADKAKTQGYIKIAAIGGAALLAITFLALILKRGK